MSITLKAARVNKGLTQQEAADAIGVSAETISNFERGKQFPNVKVLKRIEIVYGVPYNDLEFFLS